MARPHDAHVDQSRHAQQHVVEAAQVDRQRSECIGVDQPLQRVQPQSLRRCVLGVRGDHVQPLARSEQCGDLAVQRGVVGMDDHFHRCWVEHRVEVVVHRATDERHSQPFAGGHGVSTMRMPLMPPSTSRSMPVVNVVSAARYATASATAWQLTSCPIGWRLRSAS